MRMITMWCGEWENTSLMGVYDTKERAIDELLSIAKGDPMVERITQDDDGENIYTPITREDMLKDPFHVRYDVHDDENYYLSWIDVNKPLKEVLEEL